MIAPEALCPCGSGQNAAVCCVPETPPIADRRQSYSKIDLRAELVGPGIQAPLPTGMTMETTLRQPHQLEPAVEDLLLAVIDRYGAALAPAVQRGVLRGQVYKQLSDIAAALSALNDALHALRYHQRQFLCRLNQLETALTVNTFRPTGNVRVFLDDMPMRYELQAFLTCVSTCLDTVARAVSILVWPDKEPITYGKLRKRLDQRGCAPENLRVALLQVFRAHAGWIDEAKQARHDIVHTATFEIKGFGFRGSKVINPLVAGVSAGHLCFRVWRSVLELVDQLFQLVVPPLP